MIKKWLLYDLSQQVHYFAMVHNLKATGMLHEYGLCHQLRIANRNIFMCKNHRGHPPHHPLLIFRPNWKKFFWRLGSPLYKGLDDHPRSSLSQGLIPALNHTWLLLWEEVQRPLFGRKLVACIFPVSYNMFCLVYVAEEWETFGEVVAQGDWIVIAIVISY